MLFSRQFLQWPREESNLRTQIRSLPLSPLSYGAPGLSMPEAGHEEPRGAAASLSLRSRAPGAEDREGNAAAQEHERK
jgi:hypothetical protein